MKFNNKYYDIKRRLIAFAMASYLGVTSAALTSCGINDNGSSLDDGYYNVMERDSNMKKYIASGWFCDVWTENYDNEKINGAKFQLFDSNGTLINEWVSSDTPFRITGLDTGKYTLIENPPEGYITANNNYKYEIEVGNNDYSVLAIKHVAIDKYFGENINNVLSSGKEEDITDEYFVLRLRDSYINRMNDKDYLKYENGNDLVVDELPKYVILKGTSKKDSLNAVSEGSVIYNFEDVTSFKDSEFSLTDISLTCNLDGSYQTIVYSSFLGLKGSIYNMSLYMMPLKDLTNDQINELFDENVNNQEIMDFLKENGYSRTTNKIRVLKKN